MCHSALAHYAPLLSSDSLRDLWRRNSGLLREIRFLEMSNTFSCLDDTDEPSLRVPDAEFVDLALAFDQLNPGLLVSELPGFWLAGNLDLREFMRLISYSHFAHFATPINIALTHVDIPPLYAPAALHHTLVFRPDDFDNLRSIHKNAVLIFWENFDIAPLAERIYGPNLDWGGWQCLWLFALRNGSRELFDRMRTIHGDNALAEILADDKLLTLECLTSPAHPAQLDWVLDHLPDRARLASVSWRLGPVRLPMSFADFVQAGRASSRSEYFQSPLWTGSLECGMSFDFGELAEKLVDRHASHLLARFGGAAEALAAALDRRPEVERSLLLSEMAAGALRNGHRFDYLLAFDLACLRDYAKDAFLQNQAFSDAFTMNVHTSYVLTTSD